MAYVLCAGVSLALAAHGEEAVTGCAPKVRLRGTLYTPDLTGFQPGVAEILDTVATQFPKVCPGRQLLVEGHTTELPTPELNQLLSQLRAAAVREELVRRGMERNQIVVYGFGDTRPLAPPTDPDARELNRRVTFRAVE